MERKLRPKGEARASDVDASRLATGVERETPRHGFQGNRAPAPPRPAVPASLTIAVSRETGSRGGTIARRAGKKLGWQVYDQELLEYAAQEGAFRQGIVDSLSKPATEWAEEHLKTLIREQNLSEHSAILDLARVVLALGAQGEAIVLGRGAGCILPPASTLHVRIVAPLADRIAYMSQYLLRSEEETANEVELRDNLRFEFITTHFHRQPNEVYQYDLILNSGLLGEETCAELIAQAARAKLAALKRPGSSPSVWLPDLTEQS
jgi:cytidylate kinase